MKWLAHAFAIDPPGPAQPSDAQRVVVEAVCADVVRRRLTAPALLALEMARPLNFLSAQVLHFFQPFLSALGDTGAYDEFIAFLEQRGSMEYIAGRLEALEAESDGQAAS